MLELAQVVKQYSSASERVNALDGVSLSVNEGEVVALQGPSGSGKTTLLLLAACALRADSGYVSFKGRNLAGLTEQEAAQYRLADIGLIAQNNHLMAHVTAVENAATKLLLGGVPLPQAREQSLEWLERVGIGDRAQRTPEELSGGERQRVAIARALAGKPTLILADEPTAALDSQRSKEVVALLGELAREQSAGVLLVTHDPEVAATADRVLRLRDGHLENGTGEARPFMSRAAPKTLVTKRLLRPQVLIYFYRRRLRAHGVQELLAGVGIAAAVALVLAASVAQNSIIGSTKRAERAVIGPASLQLRARGPEGFSENLLPRAEALAGVRKAAPLLERSMRVLGANGAQTTIYVAGSDISLSVLNGLGRTLPLGALTPGELGLSSSSARALGVKGGPEGSRASVTVIVGGVRQTMRVSAVLGRESIGVLASAQVAVMPLQSMQKLLGQPGQVNRILVETAPGATATVAKELRTLAGGKLIVSSAEQDVSLLAQALRPSSQASDLFAVIGALLGFLFAFNAILLTVPERRQAIADLRLSGTRRSAIVQLASFQALCLGIAASAVGVLVGYALSRWVFHQSTSYLAGAFTINGGTVVAARSVLIAGFGGILVTWLASALPLLDLRPGRAPDSIYMRAGVPGNALARRARAWLFALALVLLALATVLYATTPSGALAASIALALSTVLAVPVIFAAVLAAAHALSERAPRLSTLAIALGGVRGTTLRSLALAATGSVALFGSVALGGARANLLSGIRSFAHSYAADAPIWVSEPGDNQATAQFAGNANAKRLAQLQGVSSVQTFQGTFLTFGRRRVWIVARPPGGARQVLATQTIGGATVAAATDARLSQGGWIAVSQQIAAEHHTASGGTLTLPTPSGEVRYRIAALTSNLAWSPGVVFMSSADFARAWNTTAASTLAVSLTAGTSTQQVIDEIKAALGPRSGLEVVSAASREAKINALTSEGLSQLGLVSTLLVLAAILALAAALGSSIHQRRVALAGLRLTGADPARLRRILLVEAALMLGAGCIAGALAGVYGQFVIDAYLRHVTGFPVAHAGVSGRPLEIIVLVLAAALAAVAVPGWLASRVPPALGLAEE